jgi:hypothetical protein
LRLLQVELATIDAAAISHAHYDHTGGLATLLERLRPWPPLYANPGLFRGQFSRAKGEPEDVGLSLSREALAAHMSLMLRSKPRPILPGIWTTGEIVNRSEPEGRSAHAGLLNTLARVQCTFNGSISVIAGGLHLSGAGSEQLWHIPNVLSQFPALERVYPNHFDCPTFVADGEPTLDLKFGREIELLKGIGFPIAVIANTSILSRPELRRKPPRTGSVSSKIEPVAEDTWRQINRPHGSLELDSILKGALGFARSYQGQLTTETMLVQAMNDSSGNFRRWLIFWRGCREPWPIWLFPPARQQRNGPSP